MILRSTSLLLSFCLLLGGCHKSSDSTAPQGKCGDPDALNYDPSGKDSSVCDYAKAHLQRNYGYLVSRYDFQPSHVGSVEAIQISNDEFAGLNPKKDVTLLSFMSLFDPMSYPLVMHGYDFTITMGDSLYYAGAQVTGNGSFKNGAFTFSGKIHRYTGDSWAIELTKEP